MNVLHIKPNKTLVTLYNGIKILYSHSTPVVIKFPKGRYKRTEVIYSRITENHINSFLKDEEYDVVPQAEINEVVNFL